MTSAKLKSLKVAELKDILLTAGVPFPPRANKSDLIAKISASPAAINAFNATQAPKLVSQSAPAPAAPQNDDLLAPPEDVDWNTDAVDPSPVTKVAAVKHVQKTSENASKPSSKPPPAATYSVSQTPATAARNAFSSAAAIPVTAASAATTTPKPVAPAVQQPLTQVPSVEDEELAKRKKRAERFGVPFVEPPMQKQAPPPKAVQPRTTSKSTTVDDPEKLAARGARFGHNSPASTPAPKRGSPVETVDKEELERRAKRAKRFNLQNSVAKTS